MPNRILQEKICTSETLARLSLEVEAFFYRVMVQADDYGRFDARPAILRARCFPLHLDKICEADIIMWLADLETVGLVEVYEVNGQKFLQIRTWGRYQDTRSQRSKYPAPPAEIDGPREHPLPTERDIEDVLHAILDSAGAIGGEAIVELQRQVRVQESYLDIVAKTSSTTFVLELKRGRLSNKAIEQVLKYARLTDGQAVLVGNGLAANFDLATCQASGVAVFTYDDDLEFTLVCGNSQLRTVDHLLRPVISREITPDSPVISREITLHPYPYPVSGIRYPEPESNPEPESSVHDTTQPVDTTSAAGKLTTLRRRRTARAAAPDADAEKKQPRQAAVIDAIRAQGVPIVFTSRDGAAIKRCDAPPADIAAAYCAAYKGEWDNDWLRGQNLSIHSVIDRMASYYAQRERPAARKGSISKQSGSQLDYIEQAYRMGQEIEPEFMQMLIDSGRVKVAS